VTLEALCAALGDAGLNLTGTLPPDEYDRSVSEAWQTRAVAPDCRGVVVVGNAGHALWPRFLASPESRLRKNPLDRYTERVLRELSLGLAPPASYALYTEKREERYLPLVALAERAGFGRPGRVGLLLHPSYGPWISIRGLLYVGFEVPLHEPAAFEPCTGCPAPCETACHGSVISSEGFDGAACFRTKVTTRACRAACDARAACVIGPEHAFSAEQVAHHSRIRWRPAVLKHAARVLIQRR
jgi:hypothetical protein